MSTTRENGVRAYVVSTLCWLLATACGVESDSGGRLANDAATGTNADAVTSSGGVSSIALGSYEILGTGIDPCGYPNVPWTDPTRFHLDIVSNEIAIVSSENQVVPGDIWFDRTISFVEPAGDCAGPGFWPEGPLAISGNPSWAFELDPEGVPTRGSAQKGGPRMCGQTAAASAYFSGSVQADDTPPAFEIVGSEAIEGVLLPWNSVAVVASEAVDADTLQNATTASIGGESVTSMPVGVPGTTTAYRLELIDTAPWLRRNGQVVRAEIEEGVADLSGNVSAASVVERSFADLGEAVREISFDGGAAPVLAGFTVREEGDPDCPPGETCAAWNFAPDAPFGLAARLDVANASRIRIRYSAGLYSPPGPGPGNDGSITLGFELISPDGARTFWGLHTPGGGEIEYDLPEGASEAGLELRWYQTDVPPCYGNGYVDGVVSISSIVVL